MATAGKKNYETDRKGKGTMTLTSEKFAARGGAVREREKSLRMLKSARQDAAAPNPPAPLEAHATAAEALDVDPVEVDGGTKTSEALAPGRHARDITRTLSFKRGGTAGSKAGEPGLARDDDGSMRLEDSTAVDGQQGEVAVASADSSSCGPDDGLNLASDDDAASTPKKSAGPSRWDRLCVASPSNRLSGANAKTAMRVASFLMRRSHKSTSSTTPPSGVLTAGKVVVNEEREQELQQRYDERIARARSGRQAGPSSAFFEAGVENQVSDLSPVREENSEQNYPAESLYVHRNGRFYDLNGNEFRAKRRTIRFTWK